MANDSFLDLAAGEGAIANQLYDDGARDVDACESNPQNVKRIWKLRALTGRPFGRVGLVDTENLLWHRSFERSYDVVVAIGPAVHGENPALFCRNLFQITKKFAIVQADPFVSDTTLEPVEGSLVTRRNSARDNTGTKRFLTEIRPNAKALADLLLNAGFHRVERVRSDHSEERELSDEVLIAVVDETPHDGMKPTTKTARASGGGLASSASNPEPRAQFSAFSFLTTFFSASAVTPGSLMLDVGAQRGQFSRAFAKLGFNVLAFEASPLNYAELVSIVEPFASITAVNRAVLDVDVDEIDFYFSSEFIGINSLKLNSSHLSEDSVAVVQGVRLATFLGDQASNVRVIKTDIEGADLLAIRGFDLANHQPDLILSEYGRRSAAFGYDVTDMVDYLESFGYEAWCSNYDSGLGLPFSAVYGEQSTPNLRFFGKMADCSDPNWGDALFFRSHLKSRLQEHARGFSFGDAEISLL